MTITSEGYFLGVYPHVWFVAHSGFVQSKPLTEKEAKAIVADKSVNDLEWEAVEYQPVTSGGASQKEKA